jgi:O-antigen ligase
MIDQIINSKRTFLWISFHILLGFLTSLSLISLVVWYYLVLISYILDLLSSKSTVGNLLLGLTYLSALELISRMSKASPLIPYEAGKYVMFIILIGGLLMHKSKSFTGWLMLILILPACFYNYSQEAIGYQGVVLNVLNTINIALFIVLLSRATVQLETFEGAIRLLGYALIPALVFTIIKTPNYQEIEFSLGANFSTSGGFGSNQVSTAFGLGAFVFFLAWLLKWKFSGYVLSDLGFFFLFSFQGLLTFSRGGMMGGFLAIGIVLLFNALSTPKKQGGVVRKNKNIVLYSFLGVLLVWGIFRVADGLTDGVLSLRYQGETAGTLGGSKEKTLNSITSNRFDIFTGDLALWAENPLLGVGVGASRYLRSTLNGVISHVEFSRLLVEHGLLGLLFFLILLSLFFSIRKRKEEPVTKSIQLAFFVLAIYTTFHAATRTFVTPLLIALSVIRVVVPSKQQ